MSVGAALTGYGMTSGYTVFLGKDFVTRTGPRRWFAFAEWEGGEDWEMILFRRWLMIVSKKRKSHHVEGQYRRSSNAPH